MPSPTESDPPRRTRWPLLVLALGLAWTALIRFPMILNAVDHLDSDLAVDGLTLLDAARGNWRWHYPGTPHIGILPVLASFPQALALGVNSSTLVSGGTVLWLMVVASTFALAQRAFGPRVAAWAILPLASSSVGTIWLSSRITGGHLLALGWHAIAFYGLARCLQGGGRRSAAILGAWCGLGIYNDAMGLFTIAGVAAGAILGRRGIARPAIPSVGAFAAGVGIGLLPLAIGRWIDPYDAYPAQFEATYNAPAIAGHAEILARDCLPRLLSGTRLRGVAAWSPSGWLSWLMMAAFSASVARLGALAIRSDDPARRGVAGGTLASAFLIASAFLFNRNIYNSDNYRYLIFLLVPWSLGLGVALDGLARRGVAGRSSAGLIAAVLVLGMTLDASYWYMRVRNYVKDWVVPVAYGQPPWDELVVVRDRAGDRGRKAPGAEAFRIPADVTHVFGGYWDVYRLAFLSGGRVVGVPYTMYPNRFRGWSLGLGPGRGKILILRPWEESSSDRPASETSRRRQRRVRSARGVNWRPAMETAWRVDGRDPAELGELSVLVP